MNRYVFIDDKALPVVSMLNKYGDETSNPNEAVVVVCRVGAAKYITVKVTPEDRVTWH